MQSMAELIQRGWADHEHDAEGVATRLAAALAQLSLPADVEPFARLAAHVCGEHLGDTRRGAELLRALRALPACDAAGAAAIARGMAALACAGGDEQAPLSLADADAAYAFAQAASMRSGQGDLAGSTLLFRRALERAQPGLPDGAPAIRAIAVVANNLACALQAKSERGPIGDADMLGAARVALAYWKRAGGWLEEERAEYVLSRSLTLAGDAPAGLAAARRCLAVCERNSAPAFERFFASYAVAAALRAADDAAGFARARSDALDWFSQVEPGERRWCEAELRDLGA